MMSSTMRSIIRRLRRRHFLTSSPASCIQHRTTVATSLTQNHRLHHHRRCLSSAAAAAADNNDDQVMMMMNPEEDEEDRRRHQLTPEEVKARHAEVVEIIDRLVRDDEKLDAAGLVKALPPRVWEVLNMKRTDVSKKPEEFIQLLPGTIRGPLEARVLGRMLPKVPEGTSSEDFIKSLPDEVRETFDAERDGQFFSLLLQSQHDPLAMMKIMDGSVNPGVWATRMIVGTEEEAEEVIKNFPPDHKARLDEVRDRLMSKPPDYSGGGGDEDPDSVALRKFWSQEAQKIPKGAVSSIEIMLDEIDLIAAAVEQDERQLWNPAVQEARANLSRMLKIGTASIDEFKHASHQLVVAKLTARQEQVADFKTRALHRDRKALNARLEKLQTQLDEGAVEADAAAAAPAEDGNDATEQQQQQQPEATNQMNDRERTRLLEQMARVREELYELDQKVATVRAGMPQFEVPPPPQLTNEPPRMWTPREMTHLRKCLAVSRMGTVGDMDAEIAFASYIRRSNRDGFVLGAKSYIRGRHRWPYYVAAAERITVNKYIKRHERAMREQIRYEDVLTFRSESDRHLAVVDSPFDHSPYYPGNPDYDNDPQMRDWDLDFPIQVTVQQVPAIWWMAKHRTLVKRNRRKVLLSFSLHDVTMPDDQMEIFRDLLETRVRDDDTVYLVGDKYATREENEQFVYDLLGRVIAESRQLAQTKPWLDATIPLPIPDTLPPGFPAMTKYTRDKHQGVITPVDRSSMLLDEFVRRQQEATAAAAAAATVATTTTEKQ